MAPHSSTLAWKIPWMEEPGGLQPMGSRRVGHDWATSLSLFTFMHWRRKWQPTPVFLPGESQGRASLPSTGSHRVRYNWSDLAAAAVSKDKTPINIVSDSAYVVGMTKSIETTKIKQVNSEELFLFLQPQKAISSCFFPFLSFFITRSRAHSPLPWQFSGWSFNNAHF